MSRESWRKIEQIQNNFITHILKTKGNTLYPIFLTKNNPFSREESVYDQIPNV